MRTGRFNTSLGGLPALLVVFLTLAALPAGYARAQLANADPEYADPFLFPTQRCANMIRTEFAPMLDGKDGAEAGLNLSLHTSEAMSLTFGLGQDSGSLVSGRSLSHSFGGQLRAGGGDPSEGGSSFFLLGIGYDSTDSDNVSRYVWSSEEGGHNEVYAEKKSLLFRPGYSYLSSPFPGFSWEMFLGARLYVFNMFEGKPFGWKDTTNVSFLPAIKFSYELIPGGHAVAETRIPATILQNGKDRGFDLAVEAAIGWRQMWGPLAGGAGVGFGLVNRDWARLIIDLGVVFY